MGRTDSRFRATVFPPTMTGRAPAQRWLHLSVDCNCVTSTRIQGPGGRIAPRGQTLSWWLARETSNVQPNVQQRVCPALPPFGCSARGFSQPHVWGAPHRVAQQQQANGQEVQSHSGAEGAVGNSSPEDRPQAGLADAVLGWARLIRCHIQLDARPWQGQQGTGRGREHHTN